MKIEQREARQDHRRGGQALLAGAAGPSSSSRTASGARRGSAASSRIALNRWIRKTSSRPISTGTTSGLLMSMCEYVLNMSGPRKTSRFPAMCRIRYRNSRMPGGADDEFGGDQRRQRRGGGTSLKIHSIRKRLTQTNRGRYDSVFCTYENSRVSSQSHSRALRRAGAVGRSRVQGRRRERRGGAARRRHGRRQSADSCGRPRQGRRREAGRQSRRSRSRSPIRSSA